MSSSAIKNEGVLSYINTVGGLGSTGGGAVRASGGGGAGGKSWFEAMAQAWGNRLDSQANEIISLSDALGSGQNNPSQVALLTAASQEMAFLAQSAATSQNSSAQAIENLAKRN